MKSTLCLGVGIALIAVACSEKSQPVASEQKSLEQRPAASAPKPAAPQTETALTDQKQKVSYSIGLNMGNAWKRQDVEVDLDIVNRGIKDALSGAKPLLTDEEMRSVMMAYQTELRNKQQE